ncbi:F-actin-monooxygenase MICAL3-like [Anarrhichthys ocellatus]|uniref:F-actin-monooxygenase MICAL3-like n=1 Tax=Anarrhichthys ocellatus TaxID=433405 RepID=UPI0012EE90CA|nr:F-actin-monooxygenase MICAL3-like [Anarrhichthys ocellatus]XP_031698593.1 F-actin-monooxygenase MICAL3-like [Anarrhichthys ocellatus]
MFVVYCDVIVVLLVEGEYSPLEMERRSGLWLLLEETEEFSPLVSVAGSDVTHCDTPASPPPSRITSFTPPSDTLPTANTPSTTSFITMSDSAHDDEEGDKAPPTWRTHVVITETAVQRHPAGGGVSFDDNSTELKKPLLLHGREAGPDGERAAPHPRKVEVEGGGATTLWRSVFSENRKEKKKKKSRTLPPGTERDAANQRRATDERGGLTEESDLDSSALLQRCSLKPGNNVRLKHTYVNDIIITSH